jgi:hypothetical protein
MRAIKYIGNKYNSLTVVGINSHKNKKGEVYFDCVCDCGNTIVLYGYAVRSGERQSCGCRANDKELQKHLSGHYEDLTGLVFNSLSVLKLARVYRAGRHNKIYRRYLCRCKCGNETEVLENNLKQGAVKSCGCALVKLPEVVAGDRFYKWTVLSENKTYIYENGQKQRRMNVICECGTKGVVSLNSLRLGTSRQCKSHSKKEPMYVLRKRVLNHYKTSAKKRGHIFNLNEIEFHEKIQKSCYYCGSPPSNITKLKEMTFVYNGLDRIDSKRGYSIDNVVTACANCNRAKLDLTQQEFFDMIKKIHKEHKLNE